MKGEAVAMLVMRLLGGIVDEPISRHLTKRVCHGGASMGKTAVFSPAVSWNTSVCTRSRLRSGTGRAISYPAQAAYIHYHLPGRSWRWAASASAKGAFRKAILMLQSKFDRCAYATMLRFIT